VGEGEAGLVPVLVLQEANDAEVKLERVHTGIRYSACCGLTLNNLPDIW
jgi:hypothetical protein